jgi:zinc protease
MPRWSRRTQALLSLTLIALLPASLRAQPGVDRVTLANGLRVVIIHDPLAPVVSVYLNYLVGGDETPAGFPGMAHAQEHMAFRGCAGLTADQTAGVFAQLGGDNDADTQQNITQFFETVPAQDLSVALHASAACMHDIGDAQTEWDAERGAIEQEVASDLSDPAYRMLVQMNNQLFAGTPYQHDPLGTKASFDSTTGAMLKQFYHDWYAPNNAILIIAGDVQTRSALPEIIKLYGDVPRRETPPRPSVTLQPIVTTPYNASSDYPYVLTTFAFRAPGTDSPDYAAMRVLVDVLASQRGDIYALVANGQALDAGFELAETYRQASMALAYAAVPAGTDAATTDTLLRRIFASDVKNGVPPDLVDAAKRSEVANAAFARNSIPGVASLWSEVLAAEGRHSPQDDVDAIERVSIDDVNRVAKEYLSQEPVMATLEPQPSGQAVASSGFGGAEQVTSQPTKPVPLPAWAEQALGRLDVPTWQLHPLDTTLQNGLRLIVETDLSTPTVTIEGDVRQQPDLEVPAGHEGLSSVVEGLFSYGTTSLDRIAFQKALDDIAADEAAGRQFSLKVLATHFDRGVQLLADNELRPGFPDSAFLVVRQQTEGAVAGQLKSPGYLAHRATLTGLLPAGDPELRQPTPETVHGLELSDVKQYLTTAFRPDLTTIVVIGDVTADQARRTVEKYFGSWQAAGPKPAIDLPPVPRNHPAANDVPDPSRVQDEVELAEELPMNRFDPDYYPLEVGNHVLGGGFYATRLYRDLREQTGYVYYVENELQSERTRSVFSVTYGCDADNVSKARALAVRDLEQMQSTDVSPAELQQAKALLLRQIPLAEASESNVAIGFLHYAVLGLPLDEPRRAARIYAAVTASQVRSAFAKWIRPQDFVEVVRGPAPH